MENASNSNNVHDLRDCTDVDGEALEKTEHKPFNMSAGAVKLRSWLNKSFRVEMVDGRVLIGVFLCTDRDSNIILGSCTEYLPADENQSNNTTAEEPRMLGLVMIPGKHIVSVSLDQNQYGVTELCTPLSKDVSPAEIT